MTSTSPMTAITPDNAPPTAEEIGRLGRFSVRRLAGMLGLTSTEADTQAFTALAYPEQQAAAVFAALQRYRQEKGGGSTTPFVQEPAPVAPPAAPVAAAPVAAAPKEPVTTEDAQAPARTRKPRTPATAAPAEPPRDHAASDVRELRELLQAILERVTSLEHTVAAQNARLASVDSGIDKVGRNVGVCLTTGVVLLETVAQTPRTELLSMLSEEHEYVPGAVQATVFKQ